MFLLDTHDSTENRPQLPAHVRGAGPFLIRTLKILIRMPLFATSEPGVPASVGPDHRGSRQDRSSANGGATPPSALRGHVPRAALKSIPKPILAGQGPCGHGSVALRWQHRVGFNPPSGTFTETGTGSGDTSTMKGAFRYVFSHLFVGDGFTSACGTSIVCFEISNIPEHSVRHLHQTFQSGPIRWLKPPIRLRPLSGLSHRTT